MAISSRRTADCCTIPIPRFAIKPRWRGARGSPRRRPGRLPMGYHRGLEIPTFRMAFARIVTHYVRHYAWLEDGALLRDAHVLGHIPGIMVNGRFDLQAPIGWAYDLKLVWPRAKLVIVDDAGHDASNASIAGELVRATDRICAQNLEHRFDEMLRLAVGEGASYFMGAFAPRSQAPRGALKDRTDSVTNRTLSELNDKLRLFFSLRRLPPEFADVERLTLRSAMAAMVILPPFLFPGRHYFLYPICGILIAYVGRVVGFVRHYRGIAKSSEPRPPLPRDSKITGILLTIGMACLLASTLYWAWTTRDPVFMMQSTFGAIVLTYCIGRYWAPVPMGVLNIFLMVGSLALYFHFLLAGFLAAAAFASLLVWHFLIRRSQRPTPGQFSESIGS